MTATASTNPVGIFAWLRRHLPEGGSGVARTAASIGLVAVVMAVLPRAAAAQSTVEEVGTGIRLHHIDFGSPSASRIESVTLLTVPVAARARLGERVTVDLGGYYASGEVDRPGGGSATVNGLTDATLTASVEVVEDLATVSAVAELPTGQTAYEPDELDVVGVIASDLFPFRISNWGTGGGAGLRATVTRELGTVGTSVSVGYIRSGEFDPVEGELVGYRPGDRLNARGVLTIPVGSGGQLGLQGGLRRFSDDEVQGQDVFDAGNRYDVVGSYSFSVGNAAAGFLYGGYQGRGEGRRLQLEEQTAPQDMFLAGSGLRFRWGELLVRPAVDARIVQRDDDRSEGYGVRVGGRVEWPVGGTTLVPLVRAHFGNVSVQEERDSGYLGLEVGLSTRLGGGAP